MGCLLLSVLLIVMSSTAAAEATVKEHCHPQDKRALLAIKQSFNNGTHFPSWTADNDCCRYWDGVKCDPLTHRVNHLSILGFDGIPSSLSGVIPEEVGDLSGLTLLRFHKLNNLTGTVPHSVSRLQNLISADFSWNSLSGPVPDFFRHMRSLRFLDLSFNRFSGSIPPSLALGPAITAVDLSRNFLSGSIPDGFGSFRNLGISLELSHNMLTGVVPTALGKVRFANIDLSRNDLTGDVAFLFTNGSYLEEVNLSRNRFSFNMSNVAPLDSHAGSLILLDVSHNQIFGSLPSGLDRLPNLQFLNVSYNRLCGQIPTGGELSGFDKTCYAHNKCLCGSPLPACH